METQRVGIREFRERLSEYLLGTEGPVAITRHGDTVGYYIPARRKRTEAEKQAAREAFESLQKAMAIAGVTEDEIMADFKELRRVGRTKSR